MKNTRQVLILSLSLLTMNSALADDSQCKLYGVHDQGLNDSQLFTISVRDAIVSPLGDLNKDLDIEALDLHPETGELYAASGDDTDKPGHLYRVDKATGALTEIGFIGFQEVDGLSFRPGYNTLWGWAENKGLIEINTETAQGVVKRLAPNGYYAEIEDLTWSNDGSLLYLVENIPNNNIGSSVTVNPDSQMDTGHMKLWRYDYLAETLDNICEELMNSLGEIEALETLPGGLLLIGFHHSYPAIGAIDVENCQMVIEQAISTSYDDVEGLAWSPCEMP